MNHREPQQSPQDREAALFAAALVIHGTTERNAFLNAACRGDAPLRQRLEARLEGHGDIAAPDATETNGVTASHNESEGSIIGRYKLVEKLGEGGFGAVWLAEQKEPIRRKVALKIIKLGMDTKAVVARFEAERQALAMMDHPNIARVFDAGATDIGRPYFVMELVRGIRITDYCDQANLSTRDRLELFVNVCQAIQHAHQKGIIHRDIKPSNVMVTLHDGVPVPKVIDFGIAKATQGELTEKTIHTQFQQFIGTPAYVSPEQAEMSGLDIDTRSDIYSLGVLLYELLAGTTPFDVKELMSQGIDAMRRIIREKEPQRPSTRLATLAVDQLTTTAKRRSVDSSRLLHQLKGDLDWIVMKCLEKDRTRRYETANGLATDIRRHIENEAVSARPPSLGYKMGKVVRRNKMAFLSAGIVFVALVMGISLATLGWMKARKERDIALEARSQAEAARAGEALERERAQAAQNRESQLRLQAQAQELAVRRRAYAADMNRVQQELVANNLRRARDLLKRHVSKPGEKDVRGWEWRYLWQQARGNQLTRFSKMPSRMTEGGYWFAGYTGDGKQIVSYNRDAEIAFWDIASRTELSKLQPPTRTRAGFWYFIRSPCLSKDGTFLAAPGRGTTNWVVRVWNTSSRSLVTELQFGEADCINGLAISPDNRLLACLVAGKGGTLWEIPSNRKLGDFTVASSEGVPFGAVQFTPDGSSFAVGDDRGQVHIFDSKSLAEVGQFSASQINGVVALAFSPDGTALAVGCAYTEPQVSIWNMRSLLKEATLDGHKGFVSSLAFSPDGQILASASGDQMIKLWDAASWKELGTLRGHSDEVWSVAFSSDGARILSASKDGCIYVWPAKAPPSDHSVLELPAGSRTAEVSPDGKSAAVLLQDGRISIWDVRTGQARSVRSELGTNNFDFLFSSSNELLAFGNAPYSIKSFSLDSEILTDQPVNWRGKPTKLWFVPRDRTIWSAQMDSNSSDAKLERWSLKSSRELPPVLVGARLATWGDFGSITFANDLPLIAVAAEPKLSIRDTESWRELYTLDFPRSTDVQGMSFIPSKQLIVAASLDAPIAQVWDLKLNRRIQVLDGHNQLLSTITASADGYPSGDLLWMTGRLVA